MKKICIIDYGLGNILSLKNSLEKIGCNVTFFSEAKKKEYDFFFLPGVGAYQSASSILKKKKYSKLFKFIKEKKQRLFGICLGMQLFSTFGYENNVKSKGLDIIKGDVRIVSKKNVILPIIGWNKVKIINNSIYKNIHHYNNEKFYSIHSYKIIPKNKKNILGKSIYEKENVNSIVYNHENVIGTQFHPEKSGEIGLNFLETVINN